MADYPAFLIALPTDDKKLQTTTLYGLPKTRSYIRMVSEARMAEYVLEWIESAEIGDWASFLSATGREILIIRTPRR